MLFFIFPERSKTVTQSIQPLDWVTVHWKSEASSLRMPPFVLFSCKGLRCYCLRSRLLTLQTHCLGGASAHTPY